MPDGNTFVAFLGESSGFGRCMCFVLYRGLIAHIVHTVVIELGINAHVDEYGLNSLIRKAYYNR